MYTKSSFSKAIPSVVLLITGFALVPVHAQTPDSAAAQNPSQTVSTESNWDQWRGPNRDGIIALPGWKDSVSEADLKQIWSVKLGPSYSGPIVVDNFVFTTETKDQKYEVVTAFDRNTGKKIWSSQWEGAMSVPFFARSNGSWIRATPAYDDGKLYIAGMKDVLVCLDAKTGKQVWKVDFPSQYDSAVPSFGFVCSPLVDGDAVYVQAGGGFCKLDKATGKLIWKGLEDGGGMNGSAFSSPIIAEVAGQRVAVVQTRTAICGVDLETGKELWSQDIPTFRGMNIITPIVFEGDNLLTSAYGGTTQLINVAAGDSSMQMTQKWNLPAQGYMTTPIVIDGHAYTHLRNQRFACYDLKNGVEKWRSKPFGKYASLIASGDKILALDERGELMMIRANPEKFDVISTRKVGDDSWAHIAASGNQIFVRNLNELAAFQWTE